MRTHLLFHFFSFRKTARDLGLFWGLAFLLAPGAGAIAGSRAGTAPWLAPGEVTTLVFRAGSIVTLDWQAAEGADSYGLYRGRIPATGSTGYSHFCAATEIPETSAEDHRLPEPGEAFYYLVAGLAVDAETGTITAGSLGAGSGGALRPDSTTIPCGPRVHVDPDATGAETGLTWADAYRTISSALNHGRGRDRGIEIWVRGNLYDPSVNASFWDGPGLSILGGFSGTETRAWQRRPETNPTTWSGDGSHILLWANSYPKSVVLDGLTMRQGGGAFDSLGCARCLIDINAVGFQKFSGKVISLNSSYDIHPNGTLNVVFSSFENSSGPSIYVKVIDGKVTGRLFRNIFEGSSGPVINLVAVSDMWHSYLNFDVVGNQISGGSNGLFMYSLGMGEYWNTVITGDVGSNLIRNSSGDAIAMKAELLLAWEMTKPALVRVAPLIIGNTITDAGGAGVSTLALRNVGLQDSVDTVLHRIECTPQLWDNLITFNAGFGIKESSDNPDLRVLADPLVVGNDVSGNGFFYLDEGTNTLPKIDDINSLPGASDNFEADPWYVSRATGNYHLLPGSPARDRGHLTAPWIPSIDLDGEVRIRDGNGDGIVRPDVGADEAP